MTQRKETKSRHFVVCYTIVIVVIAALVCNAFMLSENISGSIKR